MASGVNFGTQQYFNFDPRTIPNCYIWSDADTLSGLGNGTTVNSWSNLGSGGTITATGTTSNAVLNNRTVVNFTTAQTWTTGTTVNLSRYSMFAVSRQTGGTNGRVLQSTTNNQLFGYWNGYKRSFWVDGNPNQLTTAVSDTAWDLMSHTRVAGGAYTFNWNGTSLFTGSSSGGNNLTGLAINTGGYPTEDSTCQIAEILLYSDVLMTSQVQQVEGYLAWKWGLQANLPVSHPFKSNPPAMRLFQPVDVLNCAVWVDPADRSSILALSGNQPTSIRSKGHQLITLDNAQPVNNAGAGPWIGWPPPAVTNYGTVFMTNTSSNLNTFQFTRTIGGPGGQYGNGYNGSYLRIPSITFTSQQRTMFFIVSPQAVGIDNYAHIFAPTNFSGTTNMRQRGFLDYSATAYIMFPVTDGSTQVLVTGATAPYTGTMLTNGTPYIFGMRHTTSTTSNYTSVNGNSLTPPTNQALSTGYLTGTDEYVIGIFVYARQILMGDFLLYDGAIQTSEIQQIEGYLAWKWGLRTSLPTSHPFRNFPPATALFVPPLLSNTLALWFDAADTTTIGASLTITFNVFVTTSAQPVSYSGTLSSVSAFTGGSVVMNGQNIGAPSGSSARSGVWAPSATSGRWYAFVIDGGYCKTVLCQFVLTGTTLTVQGISAGFNSVNFLSSANSGATNDSYYATYNAAPIATSAFTPSYGVQSFVMNATNSSGGTVTTWQNKGTLGGTATPLTGSCTTGNTVNGLNFVQCPAGTDLQFTAALNTQARSWFFVARKTPALPSASTYSAVVGQPGTYAQDAVVLVGINSTTTEIGNGPAAIGAGVTANAPSATLADVFVCALVNSATLSLNRLTVNGTALTVTGGSAATSYATGSLTYLLGGRAGYNQSIDLMEVLFYYGDVTESQRQRVEGYLAWKWGLRDKLPDSHPYYKFRP